MRGFAIAADVAMGSILGLFLYAVVSRMWPAVASPAVAGLTVVAAVLIVLFRRPNGSLATPRERR